LKKANLTLGYDNCTPSPAILCPCGNGSRPHAAPLCEGLWVCKMESDRYGDLTARHLVWTEDNLLQQKGE
jgi:hypothetical protein